MPVIARLTAGAVLAALLMPASAAAQTGVLDANCPPPKDALFHDPGQVNPRMAETFTVINSGELNLARAYINTMGTPADWLVQINSVDGSGAPTNNVLAQTTVANSSVPPGESLLEGNFANPLTVTAGETLALVVSRPGSDDIWIGERMTSPCPPPTGNLFVSHSQTGSFLSLPGADMVFAIFVKIPPPPAPADDNVAPETTITKGPKKKTRKKTATFEFSSSEAGSTFQCKLDGVGGFESCDSPHEIKVKKGKHNFAVRAIVATPAAGFVDETPATFDWKVKKKKRK